MLELPCVRVRCWPREDGGQIQAGGTQGTWLGIAWGQKSGSTAELT